MLFYNCLFFSKFYAFIYLFVVEGRERGGTQRLYGDQRGLSYHAGSRSNSGQAWWPAPLPAEPPHRPFCESPFVTSALRLRQEDCSKLEASLGYPVSSRSASINLFQKQKEWPLKFFPRGPVYIDSCSGLPELSKVEYHSKWFQKYLFHPHHLSLSL